MNKRGLSEVITTLLFVLLALGAVLMVWVLVRNLITSSGENVDITQATLDVQIEGKTLYVNAPQEKLSLVVKRGAGKGNVTGVNVIIEDSSGNTFTIRSDTPVAELGSERIDLSYAGLGIADVKKVSIAPIYLASSGKEQTGNAVSPIKVSESQKGSALQFDGITNYITIPNSGTGSVLSFPSESFSISAWIKTTKFSVVSRYSGWIVDTKSAGTNSAGYTLRIYDNKSYFSVGNSTNSSATSRPNTILNDGKWHSIISIADRTNNKLIQYVDGIKGSENALTLTGDFSNKYSLIIGTYGGASGAITSNSDWMFGGEMDDVRIYNKALTPAEISDLYGGDSSGSVASDNLVGWWKFDEGMENTAKDSSGNGNDGTISGGAVWVEN